jgi:hypothetical protein
VSWKTLKREDFKRKTVFDLWNLGGGTRVHMANLDKPGKENGKANCKARKYYFPKFVESTKKLRSI